MSEKAKDGEMIDVMKLLTQAGFEPDCASKEWHERMDRFAALLLEEAAKICVSQGKLPSSMWGEPGCWQHSADCCAQAILAAKPQESQNLTKSRE